MVTNKKIYSMRKIIQNQLNILSLTFFIVIFGFILIFNSCEGFRCAEGTIYDIDTRIPIDSVKCIVIGSHPDNVQFSDSIGKYNVCGNWGHCYPHCPDITVQFSKMGYETKIVTNPDKSDIYLKRE
jgi:hypothetical protein